MTSDFQILVTVMHADPLTAAGIAFAVSTQGDIRTVQPDDAAGGQSIGTEAARQTGHIVIADYTSGLAILESHRVRPAGQRRETPPSVLLVTRRDKEWEIRHAMDLGARGYLLQDCSLEELIEGIRVLDRGSRFLCSVVAHRVAESLNRESLTERESEVLELLALGLCNKAIANRLGIAVGTVKVHLRGVFDKLEANTRTQAVRVAGERGLVRNEQSRTSHNRSRFAMSVRPNAVADVPPSAQRARAPSNLRSFA